MKQTVLSIEQMKRLAELGLDTNDASMIWWNFCGNGRWVITPLDDGDTQLTIEKMEDNHGKENILPTYILQDILLHLTPLHRQIVMRYEPDELLQVAYEKLVFQLTHKEDFE